MIITKGFGNNQRIITKGLGFLPVEKPTLCGGYRPHIRPLPRILKKKIEIPLYGQIIVPRTESIELTSDIIQKLKYSQYINGIIYKSKEIETALTSQILKHHVTEHDLTGLIYKPIEIETPLSGQIIRHSTTGYDLNGTILNTKLRKLLESDEVFLYSAFKLLRERT